MKKLLLLIFLFVEVSVTAQINVNDLSSLKEGDKAPDIIGVDTSGEQVQLSKVNSVYTLIYLYDFGCRHCDSILPTLIKVYNEHKKSGLEIFAIPLESDKFKLKELIKKYNLTWKNVLLDENGLSRLRIDYKLNSIPILYLLNKKKEVVGKRLVVGEDVERILKKYIH